MIRAIIVEDLPDAYKKLKALIEQNCPDIEIVGHAESVIDGAKCIRKQRPDIIFLDVHLKDGDGFDLLEIVADNASRVIFTTASDEHAIRAFQHSAIDYLLKPVEADLLIKAVEKARLNLSLDQEQVGLLKASLDPADKRDRLALHTQEQIKIALISEIVRCEAMGNYTTFHFEDGTRLLVTRTLKEFDELLKGHDFIRPHQSHLVKLAAIESYVKTEGGYIQLRNDAGIIPVSVRKKSFVVKRISEFR